MTKLGIFRQSECSSFVLGVAKDVMDWLNFAAPLPATVVNVVIKYDPNNPCVFLSWGEGMKEIPISDIRTIDDLTARMNDVMDCANRENLYTSQGDFTIEVITEDQTAARYVSFDYNRE
jgi:hypothetical protein